MVKMLVGLPVVLVVLGALLFLPLLAGLGAALFGIAIAVVVCVLVVRLLAVIMVGVGGILCGAFGIAFIVFGCVLFAGLVAALSHVLVPLLVIAAIVWFARRSARPATPPAIGRA